VKNIVLTEILLRDVFLFFMLIGFWNMMSFFGKCVLYFCGNTNLSCVYRLTVNKSPKRYFMTPNIGRNRTEESERVFDGQSLKIPGSRFKISV
jgi:hypothetical protein